MTIEELRRLWIVAKSPNGEEEDAFPYAPWISFTDLAAIIRFYRNRYWRVLTEWR